MLGQQTGCDLKATAKNGIIGFSLKEQLNRNWWASVSRLFVLNKPEYAGNSKGIQTHHSMRG